ncbi:hypothetical protein FHR90_002980 [Endobacter medicaginis]|uniref:Uncharacterized protein n=2 Tax=Endobacter medicaginis TaxID=1181271 RepID=A0A839V6R5_9PROT|nr:hypothetical protein [Endobacter medicaginis]MBB3175131.1 hypothetical protein [Endobacter medicaginis]MCX5476446.1 hypothetical protein [Endobacter medicaginis]
MRRRVIRPPAPRPPTLWTLTAPQMQVIRHQMRMWRSWNPDCNIAALEIMNLCRLPTVAVDPGDMPVVVGRADICGGELVLSRNDVDARMRWVGDGRVRYRDDGLCHPAPEQLLRVMVLRAVAWPKVRIIRL